MFYSGGVGGSNRSPDKGGPRGRTERFDQMSKQQQLIEQKKREIEAKLEVDRQRKALEAGLGKTSGHQAAGAGNSTIQLGTSVATNNSSTIKSESLDDVKPSIPSVVFANDGSFLEQFRRLQEQKQKEAQEANTKTKIKQEPTEISEYGGSGQKKALIKIMNPEVVGRSSIISTSDQRHSRTDINTPPLSNNYGAVPPPPPPPPPPSTRQQERNVGFNPHQLSSHYNNVPPPPPPPPPPVSYNTARHSQSQGQSTSGFPSLIVRNFASAVAEKGDQYEDSARSTGNPLLWFLNRPDSEEYRLYRDLVRKIRAEKSMLPANNFRSPVPGGNLNMVEQPRSFQEFRYDSVPGLKRETETDEESENGSKKKRSRWGPQDDTALPPAVATLTEGISSPKVYPQFMAGVPPPPPPPPPIPASGFIQNIGPASLNPYGGTVNIPGITAADLRGPSPKMTLSTRTNPALLDYARQSYGTIQLDEEQWKQCEEAYKMNLLFQDIARKKAKDEQLAQAGKFKYEYDSDEEVDDQGTWEHKKRLQEMEKTKQWATELTSQAKGKHHIGDFLPPEELEKFMDKYKAVKEGRQMTQSAYEDFKIAQDNVGFKLLQKMGWVDGQGLGATGQGITAPIDKGSTGADKHGLGLEQPDDVREDDDEYSAYRKRMMLAYRFRPNPLNNPRRAYY